MKFFASKSAKRRRGLGGLPLTSLIDVVFLLLIYFLVTARLTPDESQLASGLGSDKRGGSQGSDLTPQVVTVGVDNGKPVFRLGDRVTNDRISLESVLRQLPKQNGVFVKVPGQVPVWAGAMAMQACKDAGFTKISYVPTK
jgi:biopolymer transport protein ExbD